MAVEDPEIGDQERARRKSIFLSSSGCDPIRHVTSVHNQEPLDNVIELCHVNIGVVKTATVLMNEDRSRAKETEEYWRNYCD